MFQGVYHQNGHIFSHRLCWFTRKYQFGTTKLLVFFHRSIHFGGTPEDICEPQLNSVDFKQLYCELVVHGDYLHMVGHLSMATLRENPAKS